MNERRIPLIQEEPKHKKKAQNNSLPRSKHKHIYETVLLVKYYHGTDFKTGCPETTVTALPTKVCNVCGRIADVDEDPSYYVQYDKMVKYWFAYNNQLSEKALNLPKWYADDYFDKFAHKGEQK